MDNEINTFVEESSNLIKNFETTQSLSNETANEYNKKMKEIIDKLRSSGREETIDIIKNIVPLSLPITDVEKVTHANPDDEWEEIDTDDDDYDEWDEYDDFCVGGSKSKLGGSNTRELKGTGKNNYKQVYSQKHVRRTEQMLANKK